MHSPQRQPNYGFWGTIRHLLRSSYFSITYFLGVCVDSIRGPAVTQVYVGDSKNAVEELRPTEDGAGIEFYLMAREIIYHTSYARAWVPDTKRTVYEVHGSVSEQHRHLFDPRLFETVTYPLLCTPLLKWTRYPHVYAIRAHLARVMPRATPATYHFQI